MVQVPDEMAPKLAEIIALRAWRRPIRRQIATRVGAKGAKGARGAKSARGARGARVPRVPGVLRVRRVQVLKVQRCYGGMCQGATSRQPVGLSTSSLDHQIT